MATKRKRLTPATRPKNKLGRRGECGYCCEKHSDAREANQCYYFEDAYYGFDKDWNCLSEIMPKEIKKFTPEEDPKTVRSFLKLGCLCDILVKYVEFHTSNDENNAFGVNGAGDCEDKAGEFVVKITSIAEKSVQKAKHALGLRPKLPKRIKDKMSILDDPFQDGYDVKIINKMAEFEDHSKDDLQMLRCTYEALASFFSDLKKLCHFTYCHDHGRAQRNSEDGDIEDVAQLEEEMGRFELAEYWQ